ncbi:MAG: ribonuclease H-like domain-containing protein [Pseudomonadota bacterium]
MTIHIFQNDLPDDLDVSKVSSVAVDTETTGLNLGRDRLCLVQLSFGDDVAHLVQFRGPGNAFDCPNLKKLLTDHDVKKIFHFARFDIAALEHFLNIKMDNIFCTKVASKLVRTFTDRHGLRDLARDLAGVEISKQQQTSDWGMHDLTEAQHNYAAGDVLYLHKIMDALCILLKREKRLDFAEACFRFLPTRARLDLLKWDEDKDIFAHA